MPACPRHETATDTETPWDGNAAETRFDLEANNGCDMYAWRDPDGDPDTRSAFKFPHHHANENGSAGAANIAAVNNALARLGQSDIPAGDRAGVEAHLRGHRADAGLDNEEASMRPALTAAVPATGETHDDFIERCTAVVIDDGSADSPEQAVAMCESMWQDGQNEAAVQLPPEGEDIPVHGMLVPEGIETSDGRLIEQGALDWRDLPLPLMGNIDDGGDHDRAGLVGRIETIERVGGELLWSGMLDATRGRVYAEQIAAGNLRGVSVDLGDVEADFIEDEQGGALLTVSAARIMGATLVPFPAFEGAFVAIGERVAAAGITVDLAYDLNTGTTTINGQPVAVQIPAWEPLVRASAFPVDPPVEWFDAPNFDRLQAHITITDEGRIAGHAAGWSDCHIGFLDRCVSPPRGGDYSYFTAGGGKRVRCADGCEVDVGQITLVGGHADKRLDARRAAAHYDDTQSAVADVVVGEDAHGIWFAGALRPDVTPEQIRVLRASGVSGDWRQIGGRLELIAICSCNTPGFQKLAAHVASGEVVSLFASAAEPELSIEEMAARMEAMGAQMAEMAARLAVLEGGASAHSARLSVLDPLVVAQAREQLTAVVD